MRQLVYGFDAEIAEWVGERIPAAVDFGACAAIGIMTGDRLIAGVVFHNYQPDYGNIEMSMAAESPMWARKEIIAGVLQYPFVQLNCWMGYTITPQENVRALRVNKSMGFERKTVVPHVFGRKRHAVICQMLQPTYNRLYGDLNGQVSRISARAA